MGVKVIRPSGRKDWYIQVCEGGERYLRHAGSREAAFAAKKEIETSLVAGTFRKPEKKAPRYYPILRTMLYAVLRVGEAIALKWGSIDWNGKFLSVQESSWQGIIGTPKTKSSIRRVDLSPETIAVLEQHRKAVAAQSLKAGRSMPEEVFVNEPAKNRKGKEADARGGKPMDPSKIRSAHELALKEAGLRHIRIHDLRGTYTSLAVSAGVPIYYVSKSLGHSDTATTERHYAYLAPGAAREMPNVMERYIENATVRRCEPGANKRVSRTRLPCRGSP